MTSKRRTGILGGTFDPVHVGHLLIAEQARDQLGLDTVLFVPAGRPPHKASLAITDARIRAEMVALAIGGNPGFALSTSDLDQATPSLTFELLERLSEDRPHDEFVFIMGEDSLYDFGSWVNPLRVIELASLAVARRTTGPCRAATIPDVPGLADRIEWVASPQCEISSTNIRQRAASGRSIRYLVPDPVRDYIQMTGIYRDGGPESGTAT